MTAKSTTKEVRMYLRIRNLCGLLGIILPWLALFSAGIAEHPSSEWWWSISATYYQTPALVGVLVPACIVLMSYIGYDRTDNLITSLSGLFGLGIVLFPCRVSWIPDGTPVGFFQLPIELSNTIHTVCAALFFLAIAINSICQFTKSGPVMTDRKKIRNRIYRICGYGMLVMEVMFVVARLLGAPGYMVMIIEIILLHLFGFAWLVKGEAFPFLNDREEDVEDVRLEVR
ncbi:MAG: hypothetical protein IJ578_02610 [Bacteroidales bacterium]|nr:hypothetical protein [Bacteroidales bacterium]